MEKFLIWLLKKLKYSQKKRKLRSEISAAVSCTNFNRANKISKELEELKCNEDLISDGYHTFEELYYHRCVLFACICNNNDKAWKSLKHDDGTMYENYFIVGIQTETGTCSYHYKIEFWDMFKCKEIEYAPIYDGYTPSESLRRLKNEYKIN